MTKLFSEGLLDLKPVHLPAMGQPLSGRDSNASITNYVSKIAQDILEPSYVVSSLGHQVLDALAPAETVADD